MLKVILTLIVTSLTSLISLSAMADTESYPTIYTVPVAESLAQYAVFPLADSKVVNDGTTLTVTYSLPQELTGTPMSVTLSGPVAGTTLSGPNADATCGKTDSLVSCKISYTGILINPNAVKQYLTAKYSDSQELGFRLQVAAIFANEPVGIVSFSR